MRGRSRPRRGAAPRPPTGGTARRGRLCVPAMASRRDTARSCGCVRAGAGPSGAPRRFVLDRDPFGGPARWSSSLTAFGSWSSRRRSTTQPLASAERPPGRPAAAPDRRDGRRCCSLQLPVAQSAVTAIGYHSAATARSRSSRSDARATRACFDAALAPARRRRARPGLVWYQLSGDARARAPPRSSSAPRRAPTSTRRSTAPSSGSPTTSSRTGPTAPGSTSGRSRRRPSSSR